MIGIKIYSGISADLPVCTVLFVLTELAKREGADWPRFDARILTRLDCSTDPLTGHQVMNMYVVERQIFI